MENIQERISLVKQEDRDVMEQLSLSDKALEKKDRTVIDLDQKISSLRDMLAMAETDVDSRRQSIRSLKQQIQTTRSEI